MVKNWTLASKIDDLLWSEDCANCRYIRFGLAVAAIVVPVLMTGIIYYLITRAPCWLT